MLCDPCGECGNYTLVRNGQEADQPHSPQGQTGQAADPAGTEEQPDQIHRAGPSRAYLWCAGERHGRHPCANHRSGAGKGQDRVEEPRLQHAPSWATGSPEPVPGMTKERPDTLIRPRRGSDQAKDTARQPQNHPPARLSPVHCQLQTGRAKLRR